MLAASKNYEAPQNHQQRQLAQKEHIMEVKWKPTEASLFLRKNIGAPDHAGHCYILMKKQPIGARHIGDSPTAAMA